MFEALPYSGCFTVWVVTLFPVVECVTRYRDYDVPIASFLWLFFDRVVLTTNDWVLRVEKVTNLAF